jgi:hypothetical protein
MGSIVLQVNGTTVGNVADGAGVNIVKQVSEQDSGRIVMALGDYYASKFQSGLDGEPALPKTVENIIRVWFDDVVRDALKKVERYEARAITPPSITVTGS